MGVILKIKNILTKLNGNKGVNEIICKNVILFRGKKCQFVISDSKVLNAKLHNGILNQF